MNDSTTEARGVRGGSWFNGSPALSSSSRSSPDPTFELVNVGFRVASLSSAAPTPEPGSLVVLGSMGLSVLLVRVWRMRK